MLGPSHDISVEDSGRISWDRLRLQAPLATMSWRARSAVRRTTGAAVAGAYLLAVLLNFAYLYPILSAQVIPYTQWLARMWYHGWI